MEWSSGRIQTFPDDAEDPQVSLVSRKSRVIGMILSGLVYLRTRLPRGRLALVVYFGAIGLGFMALEIALLQKAVLLVNSSTEAFALVLVNLLSNALNSLARTGKEDGIVAIDATLSDDHTVCVSVTDEGTGIEPDRAQYIFEPLYSDTQTGMGVGLAICQEIISGHGGCIWYEPNPAGGAIFRFTLRTVEP